MRLGALAVAAFAAAAQAQPYDLVLRNGRIVDGTGSPWYRGDLAIRGDTIAAIAARIESPARRVIDVGGAMVAPGFVDLHTHASRGIWERPTAENYVRQGVTTIFEGPDGFSSVPLGPFFERLEGTPRSVNVASFIGHNTVRERVVGLADRKASAEEMARMRALVEAGMRDGAFGMSTGLFYTPGRWAPTEEVVDLARVVGRLGGMHNSHLRTEGARVVESVRENIAVGEQGGLPTHISHHKASGRRTWGKTAETLAVIDAARARGVDVTMDVYPYTASATSLEATLIPGWAVEGGSGELAKRLEDSATRARIRAQVERTLRNRGFADEDGGNMRFSGCPFDSALAGKTLEEAARMAGRSDKVEDVAETVLELAARGGCRTITFGMDEADVTRVLAHPASMVASDGEVPSAIGVPHPRSYGTFARVLAVYVRERGVLRLEEAVRKMSSFPAQRVGLGDRGVLRPGMKADIAVFDPATVRDLATYDDPHRFAEGFSHVIVNGQVVLEGGAVTDARPGRVLYGPAYRRR